MPYLPLGRLFWKFLIFFFLAQMTAVLGIGLAIWAIRAEQGPSRRHRALPQNRQKVPIILTRLRFHYR